ncbi:hypothetical protein DSO57_1030287 [Entomophthora muscae]|uniref:Uncharacterized protein n=1 Tax=Entomophthora muscae TaxID=34485 RepID=A0ACC2T1U8_9FUNG|nr:hypothetical protein DSO57_1030287 [Entomophthora muscae]
MREIAELFLQLRYQRYTFSTLDASRYVLGTSISRLLDKLSYDQRCQIINVL